MNDPDLDALAKIETSEQLRAAFATSVPVAHLAKHTSLMQRLAAERREVERVAIPLYKRHLESIPFYRDWDDRAWASFIGSRWVEATECVAAHLAGLPWPPEA